MYSTSSPSLPSPLLPCSGSDLTLQLGSGDQVTVESLLDETYQKASAFRIWPLLRHTAGLLHKNVEDLAQVGLLYAMVHVCTYVYMRTYIHAFIRPYIHVHTPCL